jgi:hypothetical protein
MMKNLEEKQTPSLKRFLPTIKCDQRLMAIRGKTPIEMGEKTITHLTGVINA